MKTTIEGKAFTFGKNLDTDQIYPGQYLELARVEDIKQHALEGADPDFVKRFLGTNSMPISVPMQQTSCNRIYAVWAA